MQAETSYMAKLQNSLAMYGSKSIFSHQFYIGNNFCEFLFASMEGKSLINGVNPYRKEFAPKGANSFL